MTRGYQADFYTLSHGVRDPVRRRRKALKIRQALMQYGNLPPRPLRCLDVGCSSGLMTGVLAELFDLTIGLDYDAAALAAIAPADRAAVAFVRGDAMRLPLPDAGPGAGADTGIDVALCAQVYEHVPDADRLMAELYRVLKPGGLMFFSGPNWLFPVEPHYFLPFLHWLPERSADTYLRLMGMGERYYERSRSLWGLRRMLRRFQILDITPALLNQGALLDSPAASRLAGSLPPAFWRASLPLLPNFNWIVRKPAPGEEPGYAVA